jgi:hypothetical protein
LDKASVDVALLVPKSKMFTIMFTFTLLYLEFGFVIQC